MSLKNDVIFEHEINSNSLLVFIEAYKEISEFFGVEIDVQIGVPTEGGWMTKLFLGISFVGFNSFVALLCQIFHQMNLCLFLNYP